MFCKATKTPEATVAAKVPVLTSAHEPMTMVAPGAAALAHSASRIGSTSTNGDGTWVGTVIRAAGRRRLELAEASAREGGRKTEGASEGTPVSNTAASRC